MFVFFFVVLEVSFLLLLLLLLFYCVLLCFRAIPGANAVIGRESTMHIRPQSSHLTYFSPLDYYTRVQTIGQKQIRHSERKRDRERNILKQWCTGIVLQCYCTKGTVITCREYQLPLPPLSIAAPHEQLLPLFPCPHQSVVVTQQFYRAMPVPSVVVTQQFYRAMPVPCVVVTQQFYRAMPVPCDVVTQQFYRAMPVPSVVVTQQFYRAMPVPSVVVTQQFYRAMPVPSVVVTLQFYRAMPVPSVDGAEQTFVGPVYIVNMAVCWCFTDIAVGGLWHGVLH